MRWYNEAFCCLFFVFWLYVFATVTLQIAVNITKFFHFCDLYSYLIIADNISRHDFKFGWKHKNTFACNAVVILAVDTKTHFIDSPCWKIMDSSVLIQSFHRKSFVEINIMFHNISLFWIAAQFFKNVFFGDMVDFF